MGLAEWAAKLPWNVEQSEQGNGWLIFVKREDLAEFAPRAYWPYVQDLAPIATSHSRAIAMHISLAHNISIGVVVAGWPPEAEGRT